MTVTEQPPADTAPKETTTTPDVASGPTVRQVAAAAGIVLAAAVGVVAFVAGGWIALAAAGGVAAVGGVATVKAKSKRPHKTRPGLLTTLIGRPRKPGKSTGSLPWSLTGNQAKRGALKGTGPKLPKGRGTGMKLPAVTTKGRARKAAAGTGRPLATTRPARPVAKTAKTATAAKRPGTGPGKGRGSTASKTPAKPASRGRLVTPSPKTATRPGGARPVGGRPRLATAKKATARPTGGRPTAGGKGATILPFKKPTKKAATRPTTGSTGRARPGVTSGGKKFPRMSQGRAGARRPGTGLRGTTGGKRLGGKTTGGATTRRARRLGTPKVRRHLRGPAAKVPNRTTRRPTTGTTNPTTPRLIGTALRVPRRNNRRFGLGRPTKAQQRRARRTLKLRSKLAGRRRLTQLRGLPGALWRMRPSLRLWPVMPVAPLAEWRIPTEPDPAPKRHKIRTPYPQLTGRRAVPGTTQPKENATVSDPNETITEAWTAIASFDPENALEIESFISGMGHMFTEGSRVLAELSQRWQGEQPLAAEVLEAVQATASGLAGIADIADEAHSTFQTAHEAELTRLREPRANEKAWDVTQNQ